MYIIIEVSFGTLRVFYRHDGLLLQRKCGEEAGEGLLDAVDWFQQFQVKEEFVFDQAALLQEHSLREGKLLDGTHNTLITSFASIIKN